MTAAAWILIAALAAAIVRLVIARRGIGSVRRPLFAAPRGSPAAGVRYAFTTAFLPGAKESASRHLPSYAAGLAYHGGVFVMLALLVLSVVLPALPDAAVPAAIALLSLGLISGIALLAKRLASPVLRSLSVPDDLVANLLVDAALACALVWTLRPAALPVFQLAGAALLLYVPVGKLRHMLFLFTARRLSGEHYGRRGVLP